MLGTGQFHSPRNRAVYVNFYDDPSQLGCTINADGIECEDESVKRCLSAIGLTIRIVDRSVYVKYTFRSHKRF